MAEEKFAGRHRNYKRLGLAWQVVLSVLSVTLILSAGIYVFQFGALTIALQNYMYFLMGLCLAIVFLVFPVSARCRRDVIPWYDGLLSLVSLGISTFFAANALSIVYKGWELGAPAYGVGMAAVLLLLLLEATRRTNGPIIFVLCFFFVIVPVFSSYLPGVLQGLEFPLQRVISSHVFGGDSLLGPTGRICGTQLVGYLFFAGVIQASGAGQFFLDLALSVLRGTRGSAAKVSVISSGFFGMFSGSVVSNVMTTGVFTIPAMQKQGYQRHYAAAVEACASSGGSIMPPVMAAAAFIMAELVGVSYVNIILAAALPGILYYVILFTQADAYAGRKGIKALEREEVPQFWPILAKGLPYLVAFSVLIWFLLFERQVAEAPFWAIAMLILGAMIRKKTRFTLRTLHEMLLTSGRVIAEIVVLLFTLGVVLGALSLTGVATTLSFGLVSLAGPNTWMLPFLCALAGYVMGMGVPTTACYIILAATMAPAMIRADFPIIAAHLFCLYSAIQSYIIPPVALASITAAKLAGEPGIMKTGLTAVRLGLGIFVLPFTFIFFPQVLIVVGADTPLLVTLGTFSVCLVGLVLLASSFEQYFFKWRLNVLQALLLGAGGVLIFIPTIVTDAIGIIVVVIVVGTVWAQSVREKKRELQIMGRGK